MIVKEYHMKAIHNTSFLCGCFSIKENPVTITLIDPQWKRILKTEAEKLMLEKFYYPEFVNFCCLDEASSSGEGIDHYVFPLDINVTLDLSNEKQYTLFVENIELFILPYNLLIFAIRVKQDGSELDDITKSISILRNISDYKENLLLSSWKNVLAPIKEIYKSNTSSNYNDDTFSYFNLMEYGNKLKLFQILEIESIKQSEQEQDNLLFELGTLTPINSCGTNSFFSPSSEYFDKIMKNNKISVFNNWKGLSLFDTFTILSYSTNSYLRDNWTNYYFSMIYVHSLFLKFYLFQMNMLFRKKNSKISSLECEFREFERRCCFHKISYNFLPLEFYRSLDVGLEINEERQKLYHKLEQEKNIQEKEGDRKMNSLLFYLTCLTIFSTIWDFSCLFNQVYPYEKSMGSTVFGYRLVTSILFSLTILSILIYSLAKRRK